MTPELRKEASELQLHKRGIRINVQLHVIEADEEFGFCFAEAEFRGPGGGCHQIVPL